MWEVTGPGFGSELPLVPTFEAKLTHHGSLLLLVLLPMCLMAHHLPRLWPSDSVPARVGDLTQRDMERRQCETDMFLCNR